MSMFAICDLKPPYIIRAFINHEDKPDEYGDIPLPSTHFCVLIDEKLVDAEQVIVGMVYDADAKTFDQPAPPEVVTAAQAKVALWQAGLLDKVTAAASQAEYMPMKIYFESSTEWHRGNPYVQALAQDLELPDATVDELFRGAAKL